MERLQEEARRYLPEEDLELLRRAYALALEAHRGQQRLSGGPYIEHSVAVATILAELGLDQDTLAAALLHDVPEDTTVPLERVRQEFGDNIANLVDGVTKLGQIDELSHHTGRELEQREAENLRKMFLAMAEDVRVVLIKLADRLHNMRTLWALPLTKQHSVARETLEIYAPLANRLGMWGIKAELEDLTLRHLNPRVYHQIANQLAESKMVREAYVARIMETLQERLIAEGIRAEIYGRSKHLYSIYQKMQRKQITLDKVYDLLAVRIIVEEVKDCYAALGVVHSLWPPIPGEFDDYISRPKDNLYRSLHTTVISLDGKPLEVQIRTQEMHQVAELGVAAHWQYKEGTRSDGDFDTRIAWLRQLLEWRREIGDAQEFVDSLKTDIFRDRVYVFTPKGDIVDLPAGSTPVDFAYRIHTEVGHRCRGAKIAGRLVPLTYQLQNGEQVEIITAKRGGPSRDWLNFALGYARTSTARQKIRQWFRRQNRAQSISEGKELLEKELRRLGLEPGRHEEIAALFNYGNVDDFLAAIGYGDLQLQQLDTRLLETERKKEELTLPQRAGRAPATHAVSVDGEGNLYTRLAQCCNPLPGDDIVGYVTRGRGITIHRSDCHTLRGFKDLERLMEVQWEEDSQQVYPAVVEVIAHDREGLLRDIATVVADENVNISAAISTTNKRSRIATITATLEISGMAQLARILAKVERLPSVLEARRQSS